jgi:hypothetical protein
VVPNLRALPKSGSPGGSDVRSREGFVENSIITEKNKNLYLTKFKQNCVFNIVHKMLDFTSNIKNLICFMAANGQISVKFDTGDLGKI